MTGLAKFGKMKRWRKETDTPTSGIDWEQRGKDSQIELGLTEAQTPSAETWSRSVCIVWVAGTVRDN